MNNLRTVTGAIVKISSRTIDVLYCKLTAEVNRPDGIFSEYDIDSFSGFRWILFLRLNETQ